MGGPNWALIALVVYPLLQIPLVLYLARWFELDGDAPVVTPTRTYWTDGSADESGDGGHVGRALRPPGQCRHCGAANDPAFAYCRNCVGPLG